MFTGPKKKKESYTLVIAWQFVFYFYIIYSEQRREYFHIGYEFLDNMGPTWILQIFILYYIEYHC